MASEKSSYKNFVPITRVIGMFYNPVSSNLRPSAGEARVLSITAKRQLMLSNNVCSLDFSIKIK